MKENLYRNLWLVFVNIKPEEGQKFIDLIDLEEEQDGLEGEFIGAWANVIVKSETINGAIEITPLGLKELGFEVEFIDKIENMSSLIEKKELKEDVVNEADWLIDSNFVFKISDRIFPYKG